MVRFKFKVGAKGKTYTEFFNQLSINVALRLKVPRVLQDIEKLSEEGRKKLLSRLSKMLDRLIDAYTLILFCPFVNEHICSGECKKCNLHGCVDFQAFKALLAGCIDFLNELIKRMR